MSRQAIGNPDDIDRFARELKQFNTGLAESMTRLQAQFNRVGDTWRDENHRRFGEEFQQTMRVLNHFMRSSEQQIPALQKEAQALHEYLNRRH